MDLGRASKRDKSSPSLSGSRSPPTNEDVSMETSRRRKTVSTSNENINMDGEREDSANQWFQGGLPNKIPKLNCSPDVDQQASEAMSMMRKARVSVRARSEASMVGNKQYFIYS